MNRRFVLLNVSAAVLVCAATGCESLRNGNGDDDETEVSMTLDQMPAPVRDAILRITPEANITQLTSETEGGQMVYEVEYTANGQAREAEFNAQGTLLEEGDDDDGDDDD